MKRENLFTLDLNDDEHIIVRDAFVIRRQSDALAAKEDALTDAVVGHLSKGMGKTIFVTVLLPFLLVCMTVLCAAFAVRLYTETGAFPVGTSLVALFSLFGAGGAAVYAGKYNKKREAESDRNLEQVGNDFDAFHLEQRAELSIPENVVELEIFAVCLTEEASDDNAYDNVCVDAFVEDGKLCFLYSGGVIAVPLDEVEGLYKVDAPICFDSWLKDVPYDGGLYLQYKITHEELDEVEERYTMNGYAALRFTHGGEPFEILIALYDADVLPPLIEMPLTEE